MAQNNANVDNHETQRGMSIVPYGRNREVVLCVYSSILKQHIRDWADSPSIAVTMTLLLFLIHNPNSWSSVMSHPMAS